MKKYNNFIFIIILSISLAALPTHAINMTLKGKSIADLSDFIDILRLRCIEKQVVYNQKEINRKIQETQKRNKQKYAMGTITGLGLGLGLTMFLLKFFKF